MDEPGEFMPPLSAGGEERREGILRAALAEGQRRRARAEYRRAALAAVMVGAAVAVIWPALREPAVREAAKPAAPAAAGGVVITYLQTDPHIMERLAVRPSPGGWKELSDEGLVERLAQSGVRAKVAEINGRQVVVALPEKRGGS